ncbi:MAG: metallophosphoesterase [Anaerolineae bacterium]|nr:metallophosphoesterase [Anaerolineae bacterium]
MKGSSPLHTILLLTEKPGSWTAWQVAPIPPILAAVAGWVWARVTGDPAVGWAVALGLLAFALADWQILAALPRRGVSFGPVQPSLLGLALVRWLVALVPAAALAAPAWTWPALAAVLAVQLLGFALVVYGMLIEPFRLRVTRLEIACPTLANPGAPLRIVHLSDIHVERATRRERALPALVAGLEPDLIALTGDYLNASYNGDPRAVADLQALLAQLRPPGGVYGCLGTLEVDQPELMRPVLAGAGVLLLEDRAVELSVGGHRLWLAGVRCTRDPAADGARLGDLLAGAPPDALKVILYHMPDLLPEAAALGVDLLLSGHTHGGQWRLPGFGALLTNSRYGKRYEAGHYRHGNTHLVVSRGLGMEGFGMPRARFFCPPEVVLITLSASGAGD